MKPSSRDGRLAASLVITGLGGTGKSQLILRYIETHTSDYYSILWIDATSIETTQASFERCAFDLSLPVQSATSDDKALKDTAAVRAVMRWLSTATDAEAKWLVVIDNADDFSWGMCDIVPQGKEGTVVVTSQDKHADLLLGTKTHSLMIDHMEPMEACRLLLWNSPESEADVPALPSATLDMALEISKRLEYLALAIGLAWAIIDSWRKEGVVLQIALRQYLDVYSKRQKYLLTKNAYQGLTFSYKKTVWTVWDTTFAVIDRQHPDSRHLLVLLSTLDRACIQEEVFRLAGLGMPDITQRVDRDEDSLPAGLRRVLELDNDNS